MSGNVGGLNNNQGGGYYIDQNTGNVMQGGKMQGGYMSMGGYQGGQMGGGTSLGNISQLLSNLNKPTQKIEKPYTQNPFITSQLAGIGQTPATGQNFSSAFNDKLAKIKSNGMLGQ